MDSINKEYGMELDMKIYLYQGSYDKVKESGVGKAIDHQKKALELNNIPFTLEDDGSWDIIQLNTVFPDSLRAARRARREGKKIIYYGHSTMEDFKNSFKGSNTIAPLFKKWICRCYNQGDLILTPTPYSKEILETYPLTKPILPISNGIDLDFFDRNKGDRESFRKKYNLKKEDKVVVSVGLYIDRKGFREFLELAQSLPQYQFIWFGYTAPALLPENIKEAIKNKPDNVQLPGYISSLELRDALTGSDLFLFLSHEETEGIALLEALAMKIPAIVRDIEIYKDRFKTGEAVYKGNKTIDFRKEIQLLLEGEKEDLTENAYAVVEKVGLKNVGRRLEEIYIDLLNLSPGGEVGGYNESIDNN